jgi:2-dehydropantoate 2-reductase
MKICVIGTGGVGGYFGGKLAHAGEEVWFIARGQHLQAMQERGLHIKASDEEFTVPTGRMSGTIADAGVCDLILFCVKSYDTVEAARMMIPAVGDRTVVVSLQNGIDNEQVIGSLIPGGTVFGGIAYIYATLTAPGEITENGGPRKIVFGPLDPAPDPRGNGILAVLRGAGITATLSDDMRTELWKKFVFIAAVGGLTALTRLTLGEILPVRATRELLQAAMDEAVAVGRAEGVPLDDTLVPGMFEILGKFDNRSRSSMYFDLANGRPLEIEAFSGTLRRLGRRHNIPTPVHDMLYATLLPHHLLHARTSAQPSPERNLP